MRCWLHRAALGRCIRSSLRLKVRAIDALIGSLLAVSPQLTALLSEDGLCIMTILVRGLSDSLLMPLHSLSVCPKVVAWYLVDLVAIFIDHYFMGVDVHTHFVIDGHS